MIDKFERGNFRKAKTPCEPVYIGAIVQILFNTFMNVLILLEEFNFSDLVIILVVSLIINLFIPFFTVAFS